MKIKDYLIALTIFLFLVLSIICANAYSVQVYCYIPNEFEAEYKLQEIEIEKRFGTGNFIIDNGSVIEYQTIKGE